MSISRRAFLGTAALSPLAAKAFAATGKLPTRAFGKTGATVPILAFGCGIKAIKALLTSQPCGWSAFFEDGKPATGFKDH